MIAKVVVPVRLPPGLVKRIDKDIEAGKFDNRSDAIRAALSEAYGFKGVPE